MRSLSRLIACALFLFMVMPVSVSAKKADSTAPAMTLVSRIPAANESGWNNTAVTVTWRCEDPSGVRQEVVSDVVEGPGLDLTAAATCEDLAGNIRTSLVEGIYIDRRPPTMHPREFTQWVIDQGGVWSNKTVRLSWQCFDDLSEPGAFSAWLTFETEAVGQSGTAVCTDMAGNEASTFVSNINIDTTLPSVLVDQPDVPVMAGPIATIDGTSSDPVAPLSHVQVLLTPMLPGQPIALSSSCSSCGTHWKWSLSLAKVRQGAYMVSAVTVDRAGNVSPASTPFPLVIG